MDKTSQNLPKLYVLVGLPASGKSTFAKTNFGGNDNVILSSDQIRKEIYGDESVQKNPAKVFKVLYERANKNLNENKNVVIDATNVTIKTRGEVMKNVTQPCYKIALVFNASKNDCTKLDKLRERKVGSAVIEKYAKIYQPPTLDEGFDEIEAIEVNYNQILNKTKVEEKNDER